MIRTGVSEWPCGAETLANWNTRSLEREIQFYISYYLNYCIFDIFITATSPLSYTPPPQKKMKDP